MRPNTPAEDTLGGGAEVVEAILERKHQRSAISESRRAYRILGWSSRWIHGSGGRGRRVEMDAGGEKGVDSSKQTRTFLSQFGARSSEVDAW